MGKFEEIYNLVMEGIDSNRKPIPKINAMTPKQFIEFLKEFLPYVKNGKVDLNDVRITEKFDGSALRLLTSNGKMLFESSYSGVTTYDKVPFKDAASFLYKNYSQLFNDIYNEIHSDFKIIGELIWIDKLDENGKITPVGASYLTENFGKYGGMIVFDILKIENNELTSFNEDEKHIIFDMIYDLNNEDFSFHLIKDMNLNKNVTFTLDVDELLNIINQPEFNKERFNKKTDEKILLEIQQIQSNVVNQLSQIVDQTKGSFSAEGDLIEGIVLKIEKSGNQYGIFSDGYKEMKHKYWEDFEEIDKIYSEFLKNVFNRVQRKYIIQDIEKNGNDEYNKKYDELLPTYKEKLQNAFNNINEKQLPKAIKSTQLSMAKNTLNKLIEDLPYDQFIKKYIYREES
jgi:hypothetical protein